MNEHVLYGVCVIKHVSLHNSYMYYVYKLGL